MSEPKNLLRLDQLRVRNFRCFGDCTLTLHPTLTVLVAENAQGKTALLDGLRLALQEFVNTAGRGKQSPGFERSDIYRKRVDQELMLPQLPTEFHVDGEIDGEKVSWDRVLLSDGFHARTSTKGTKDIRRVAKKLADRPGVNDDEQTDSPTTLPVVAYYGTGRLYDEHHLTAGKRWLARTSPVRSSAYLDCLSASSSYKSFATWFGEKWEQLASPTARAVGFQARPENHIAAVQDAVRTVLHLTGWTTIHWQFAETDDDGRVFKPGYIAVEHAEKGILPLSFLSDGVRNMVAFAGDLAHRCIRLNPHLGEQAAKLTAGVVLIDEVDMHLHPRWQQLVVASLQEAFPRIQFVLTTHSPHVLTTVKRESIRILARNDVGIWSANMPYEETKGIESSTAMNDVMGVNQIPPVPEAGWRDEYTALIENGVHQTEEGMKLRAKLAAHYGEQHPIILDFDRLIRFQAFKRLKSQPSD